MEDLSDNPIFSYTRRDYESSRKEGLAKIPVLSKGAWTDLNSTDPGVILLDYVHALVDMINYYQDHQALESFMPTAKERQNIFRLAKQLSYKIRSAKGALCTVEFYSSLLYDYSIKIPKYTTVSTLSGIKYLTCEDAYISPGEFSTSVSCTQGEIYTREYKGTSISRFSSVIGAANQSVHLMVQNIDIDTIEITDSIGNIWTPVDSIVFSTSTDRVYEAVLNPDDTITIKFGDGERGVVPSDTDILTIQYIVSLADEGRVSANSIVSIEDDIYDTAGQIIPLTVSNPQSSTGGSKTPTSKEIRELAIGAIKAQGRAVTLSDFENLAKQVDGVADAKAYDVNTLPSLLYYEVKVLITPEDPESSMEALKNQVYKFLSQRMLPPTNLQVVTPSYETVDITVQVRKMDNVSESRLLYAVNQSVLEYFEERRKDIGMNFYPTDLVSTISKVSGVRSVLDISPDNPVEIEALSVVRLGKLEINII